MIVLVVAYVKNLMPELQQISEIGAGNCIGVMVDNGDGLDLVLFSTDSNPVNQYIELGGYYEAADGGNYTFESTGVRVQFDGYQVLRLTNGTGQPADDWDVNSDGSVNVLDLIRVGQHSDETGSAGWCA